MVLNGDWLHTDTMIPFPQMKFTASLLRTDVLGKFIDFVFSSSRDVRGRKTRYIFYTLL